MFKYLLLSLPALAFFLAGVLILSDYGINWDSPLHMLRGQAYADIYLNTKVHNSFKTSPIIIPPSTYGSRYYFASVETDQDAKIATLPNRPLPQKQLEKGISFYQHPFFSGEAFRQADAGHLPLIATLSAFSNRVFFGMLGWLGDIESYQLIYVLFSALGVFIVAVFAFEITRSTDSGQAASVLAGVVAGLSLALFPLFFAEAHINPKDPIQASFFAGAIWSFWRWVKSGRSFDFAQDKLGRWGGLGRFGVFVIFVALALAVKWNIVFLPLILLPWLFLIRKTEEFKRVFVLKKLISLSIFFLIFTFLFLILIWPYAWANPVQALTETIDYYLETGVGKVLIQPVGFILPGGFNIYPLLLFLTQTPEVVLILGVLGVVWVVRGILRRSLPRVESRGSGQGGGDKTKTGYLLLIWLLVPLIRVILPEARSYAGIRQIMEVIPVMAILAGIGAGYLPSVILSTFASLSVNSAKNLLRMQDTSNTFDKLSAGKLRDPSGFSGESFRLPFALRAESLRMTVVGFVFILLLIPIIRLHPNQNIYFNSLVGRLPGAKEKGLIDWTLTYGNIYKQGVKWLNEHAQKDANLAHLAGSDFAISPLYLREDISISPNHFSGFDQKGEYIIALFNPLDPPVFAKRYPERFLKPVHQIEVDGVPLLFIYKNDPEYLKVMLKEEGELKTIRMIPQTTKEADFWKIDLGRVYQVTRIVVNGVDRKCVEGIEQKEVIAFIPSSQALHSVDLTRAYVLNEKRDLGEGKVEYLFAKEPARLIYIYPQNNQSCFAKDQILSVSYLSN